MPSMKEIFIATRPWSFLMTTIIMSYGILLAMFNGLKVSWLLSIMAIVGVIFLHAAVNVWNDYYDYKYGFDSPDAGTAIYRPHPLVSGFMTQSQVMNLANISALIGLALGVYIGVTGRPWAILLGALGALLAFFYTGPPVKYKYKGLGELGTFFTWGPLMTLGAYYVASGTLSWKPVIASIPLGILVSAVLLANNIRDIDVDRKNGAYTLAVRLGRNRAVIIYKLLIISSYILVTIYIPLRILPFESLVTFAVLPQARSLYKMFEKESPPDADPRTAKFLQNFGLLLLIGLIINALV